MSQIRFDYTNVHADVVGAEHGLTDADFAEADAASRPALQRIQGRRASDLRWMDLPYASEVHGAIVDYAASVRGRFENVVVLGIGGSALGNTALQTALNSPYHNLAPPAGLPRLFVLDNVDPELIGEFLATVDPSKTLFNVISKSGGTAETMSQFLIFRERLIEALGADHKEHLVVTTDAEHGVLREIVRREGYTSFVVPDGVGG
ncbi:MAG: glucose-6-phosphate isomerase, partial [Planctomycetota bacterium]